MRYRKTAVTLAAMALLNGCASAGRYDDGYDNPGTLHHFSAKARVISVEPVFESVTVNNPQTNCWKEKVSHPGHQSSTPLIAGAILGGVVGNQFGGGKGKDVMTVAGALLGGSIGNDMRHNRSGGAHVTLEQRCETVDNYHEVNELVGYNVKYRYNGNEFWTRTSSDPGDYIRVSVSVSPID